MYLRSELVSDGATSCGPRSETEAVLTCDITLTFDLSSSKWGHGSPVLWASCQFSACYEFPFLTLDQARGIKVNQLPTPPPVKRPLSDNDSALTFLSNRTSLKF